MGLRLVVYDATGHGRAAVQPLLTRSWRIGVELYRHYPQGMRADATFGATSWTDAVAWLASVEPGQVIDEIQYWGHGLPGRLFVAGEVLTAHQLTSSALSDDWRAVAARLSPTSLVWWRTCSAFAGQTGQTLASTMAAFFNCRVAGHTYVIGPLQSGLHSVRPQQPPTWSITEGFGVDGTALTSTPWAPNTITCLHGAVPVGW